jgi:hypothetical protein
MGGLMIPLKWHLVDKQFLGCHSRRKEWHLQTNDKCYLKCHSLIRCHLGVSLNTPFSTSASLYIIYITYRSLQQCLGSGTRVSLIWTKFVSLITRVENEGLVTPANDTLQYHSGNGTFRKNDTVGVILPKGVIWRVAFKTPFSTGVGKKEQRTPYPQGHNYFRNEPSGTDTKYRKFSLLRSQPKLFRAQFKVLQNKPERFTTTLTSSCFSQALNISQCPAEALKQGRRSSKPHPTMIKQTERRVRRRTTLKKTVTVMRACEGGESDWTPHRSRTVRELQVSPMIDVQAAASFALGRCKGNESR